MGIITNKNDNEQLNSINEINLLSSNEQNTNKNTVAYYIMYIMICVKKKMWCYCKVQSTKGSTMV